MGWKSTITLSRAEALEIIATFPREELSNEILGEMIEAMRGGCDHGHNYSVRDHYEPEEER